MSQVEPKAANHENSSHRFEEAWGALADLGTVTPETFDPYVGDIFQVSNPVWETSFTHTHPIYTAPLGTDNASPAKVQQVVDIELVEVARYAKLREKEGSFDHRPREPFSLLFKGQATSALMNASLPIHHTQLGIGRLLFSQVQVSLKVPTSGQSHIFYEVVFG